MNIALIDMDQTLCDYEGAVKNKLVELYGSNLKENIWEAYKPAIDMIKQTPGFWRALPKIELGFKIVDILQNCGFDIHILSKGPHKTTLAWTEKVEWCREHLPETPITITEDKSLVYGRVLVDDWPLYCEQWLQWRPRGMVIMPAYEYNVGFENKHPGQVIRATGKNWVEVGEAILRVSERKAGEG